MDQEHLSPTPWTYLVNEFKTLEANVSPFSWQIFFFAAIAAQSYLFVEF